MQCAESGGELPQPCRRAGRQAACQPWHPLQRGAQTGEVARRTLADGEAPEQTLHVEDAAQLVRDLLARDRRVRQLLDGVLARGDGCEIRERGSQPARQQARAGRDQRPIHHREQRSVAPPGRAAEELQVLHRGGIDPQRLRGLLHLHPDDVRAGRV